MSLHATPKPILFLLPARFEDGQLPGQDFFCRHSLLLEGALASIEGLRDQLDVRHIGFERPRHALARELGEDSDQSLPKLVLPATTASNGTPHDAGHRRVISGAEAILTALADLLRIPVAHP